MARRRPLFSKPHDVSDHAIWRFRQRVAPEHPSTVRLTLEGVVQMGLRVGPGLYQGRYRDISYVVVLRRDPARRRPVVTTVYRPDGEEMVR